jgi:hypothetical protein
VDANELGTALRSDLLATPGFWAYLRRHQRIGKWIIGSDYVLKNKEKPWDVMAFTLYPVLDGPHLDRLMRRLNEDIPKDIKEISIVNANDPVINLLRSDRYYSVAVMLSKNRHKLIGPDLVRKMIENSYENANNWVNRDHCLPSIKSIKNLLDETIKRNFNAALLLNISYASAIAATISGFLTSECNAELVTWVSDRDPISEAYRKAYGTLFSVGHLNSCEALNIAANLTKLSLVHDDEAKPGKSAWFDPLIRMPDYLCGAISSMDFQGNRLAPVRIKYKNILDFATADNKNLLVCRMDINNSPILKYPRISSRVVMMTATPPN